MAMRGLKGINRYIKRIDAILFLLNWSIVKTYFPIETNQKPFAFKTQFFRLKKERGGPYQIEFYILKKKDSYFKRVPLKKKISFTIYP